MNKVLFVAVLVFVGGGLSSADLVVSVAEFQAIGYDGTDQASMLTELTFANSSKNYLSHCKGSICRGLPHGLYKYQLRLTAYPKAAPIVGRADIDYPNHLITVWTPRQGDRDGLSFNGQVLGVTVSNRMWVRVMGIFTDDSHDARVGSDGRFVLHGLTGDKYMIWILQDGNVLGYQRWDCCSGLTPDRESYVFGPLGTKIMGPRARVELGKMYRPAW